MKNLFTHFYSRKVIINNSFTSYSTLHWLFIALLALSSFLLIEIDKPAYAQPHPLCETGDLSNGVCVAREKGNQFGDYCNTYPNKCL